MKKLQEKADSPELGIYVHVPFCARTCDFCQFYQEVPKRGEIENYLRGMEKAFMERPLPRRASTAFWGGGTPGLLPGKDLERLGRAMLQANGNHVPSEWTVEMAPSTVKADKLKVLRDLGVSRISVGVQTFQAGLLEALGRIHSLRQVHRGIELLHAHGPENFNLDLIFAIPGQSLELWQADLEQAAQAGPTHLSTYCLTFEEDTALWLRLQKGQVRKLSEDEEVAFFEVGWEYLDGAGFKQYEISNFARPGYACQHNLNTWRMQEWIGFGPSASSQFAGRRWTEPDSLEQWLQGLEHRPAYLDEMLISPETLIQDYLIFGLRMNEGVNLSRLRALCGQENLPATWMAFQKSLEAEGLAETSGEVIRLTRSGRLLADRIGEEILGLIN